MVCKGHDFSRAENVRENGVGLYRLLKKGEYRAKSPKNIPQGLKAALILRHLRHD
jgi:hypothetical protein